MNRIFRNTIFYLLIFLVVVGVVSFFNGTNNDTNVLDYGEFQSKLNNGEIQELTLQPERGVYTVTGKKFPSCLGPFRVMMQSLFRGRRSFIRHKSFAVCSPWSSVRRDRMGIGALVPFSGHGSRFVSTLRDIAPLCLQAAGKPEPEVS